MKPLFSISVLVPATSANLGPGFDALGAALSLHNEMTLTAWGAPASPGLAIEIQGEGAGELPEDQTNLAVRLARRILSRSGKKAPKALEFRFLNRIPLARGLGSSSAAIVAGLVAGNAATGNKLSWDDLLALAAQEEGHSDNVTPALLGGLCSSVMVQGKVKYASLKEPRMFENLKAVVAVPDFQLSTKKARAALPTSVSREAAVFSSSRVALFLSALQTGRHDLLQVAMEDKLHQPYRKKFIPGWDSVIKAALRAGGYGAALSGAGPSVVCLAHPSAAEKAGRAMCAAFSRHRVKAQFLALDFDFKGAGSQVRIL